MKFFDMFAGVGGFRLALEREGYECVGWCEIDKWCQKLYRAYYRPEGEYFKADILAIDPRELPDFDIITAGIPCQSFSYAGKRRGMHDERGLPLWKKFFEVVEAKRPKVVVIENVKGLLSSNRGWDFAFVLHKMDEIGYDAEWDVLNSKDFGVPQNRERVFIIGHLRGESRPEVFPLTESDRVCYTPPRKTSEEGTRFWHPPDTCVRAIDANYKKGGGSRTHIAIFDPFNCRFPEDQDAVTALRTNDHNGNAWVVMNLYPSGGHADRVYSAEGVSPSVTTYSTRIPKIVFDSLHGFGHGWQGYHNRKVVKLGLVRKLTPLECFRLQGFPDDIVHTARKIGISDTQLYKMAGNAVTVPVVQSIARKIKKVVWEGRCL
jgi:DNA (cytosine-5)-methyltransferase 1